MLESKEARKCLSFWTPEARSKELREMLPEDFPEDGLRAIEGGRAKRTMERKTRLLEIEQSL